MVVFRLKILLYFCVNQTLSMTKALGFAHIVPRTRNNPDSKTTSNGLLFTFGRFGLCYLYSTKPMYEEMDDVVSQVLAMSRIGNESLFNTIIYFFAEAGKLTRAVSIFKHMKSSRNLECRPSIRTYNLLFAVFLSRGSNSYINRMYMDSLRVLFRQMVVDDGIEPDIFSLNSIIKGYVLSLHVNDTLRIFHQMGVVYKCQPNAFTYDYLIHGLCAQGKTNNARELCYWMKSKGIVPSGRSYNSLVNALALEGEVDEAVKFQWEMIDQRRSADFFTYKTLLDNGSLKWKAT